QNGPTALDGGTRMNTRKRHRRPAEQDLIMATERPTSNLSSGENNLMNEGGNLLSAAIGAVTRAITGPAWLPHRETIAVANQPGVARLAGSAPRTAAGNGPEPAASPRQATCYN